MVLFAAFVIFLAINTVTWIVAVTLYQSFLGGPSLRAQPYFYLLSAIGIGLATIASLIPFPFGYVFALFFWTLVSRLLQLSFLRLLALVLILAALSFLSRLAILGALAL